MIYFIRAGDNGPIKIGFTKSEVSRRLTMLQTGSPERLTLLGAIQGDKVRESELHAQFAAHRLRGEWFGPDKTLLAAISMLVAREGARVAAERCPPLHSAEHPLRQFRTLRGLTIYQLAERIGTTATTVSRFETGVRQPSVNLLDRIVAATDGAVPAHALRPDIYRLIFGKEPPPFNLVGRAA